MSVSSFSLSSKEQSYTDSKTVVSQAKPSAEESLRDSNASSKTSLTGLPSNSAQSFEDVGIFVSLDNFKGQPKKLEKETSFEELKNVDVDKRIKRKGSITQETTSKLVATERMAGGLQPLLHTAIPSSNLPIKKVANVDGIKVGTGPIVNEKPAAKFINSSSSSKSNHEFSRFLTASNSNFLKVSIVAVSNAILVNVRLGNTNSKERNEISDAIREVLSRHQLTLSEVNFLE